MSIHFCSIDPAINSVGIAILEMDSNNKFKLVDKVTLLTKTKYASKWHRKLDMFAMFKWYLTDKIKNISFFVFEDYSYGSPGKLADLGEMIGLFKKFITDNEKDFDVIPPKTVKLIVAGHGNSSKEALRASLANHVYDFEKIVWNSLDESDAVGIGIGYALKMQEAVNELEKN